MFALELHGAWCVCCALCKDVCPSDALAMRTWRGSGVEGEHLYIAAAEQPETFPYLARPELCDGCGICAQECPTEAIDIVTGSGEIVDGFRPVAVQQA